MVKVFVDQEQDGDEEYLNSFIVYFNGDTEQFDDHPSALEFASELAKDSGAEVVDSGDWG